MIVHRQAVRAVLLTPEQEILLMRIRPPQGGTPFWVAPGGGIEEGESIEDGLRRELMEELGIDGFAVGPLLWRRRHTFNWGGRRICQREQYRAVHVARFEPKMSDAVEAKVLERFQWWPVAALAGSSETFTPTALADIVGRYLAEGPPGEPLAVEVLVD